jgi:streptomycin 3"-kinase
VQAADRGSWPPRFRDAAWQAVGEGESGTLVLRNDRAGVHAKLGPSGSREELAAERDRTQWLLDSGFPCPAVLDWVETDHHACLTLSTVPGVPASVLPAADRPAAARRIAELFRELHRLPPVRCPFARPLNLVLDQAQAVVDQGQVRTEFLRVQDAVRDPVAVLAELRALAETLAHEPSDQVICHGDACLPNIIVDPDTLACAGIIDLGRLGIADRHSDLALLSAQVGDEWPGLDFAAIAARYGLVAIDPRRLDFYQRIDGFTWPA